MEFWRKLTLDILGFETGDTIFTSQNLILLIFGALWMFVSDYY